LNKIAVLTSGGDAPGMNAAIRAVVRAGIARQCSVCGIQHGYDGLQAGEFVEMPSSAVGAIVSRGGTMLRSSRSATFRTKEGRICAVGQLKQREIQGLIVIGGDGSLTGAKVLFEEHGFPIMGIPASIDNDIPATDHSIGFQTAVDTALDAIDKVRDTAYSHERVFIIEVMGRQNGFIALEAGLAGGAEAILIPELPVSLDDVCAKLEAGHSRGKKSSIVVTAEGAATAIEVCKFVEAKLGYEARYLVLGHMQRGGSPCAFDRILATRLGDLAVERLLSGATGEMVGDSGGELVSTPLIEVLALHKPIDTARLRLAEEMAL